MYMPEYYAEKDKELRAQLRKINDQHYTLDKYQIYYDIDDLGFNDWTVLYKDHGVQYVTKTLEEAVEEIIASENFDYGDPE